MLHTLYINFHSFIHYPKRGILAATIECPFWPHSCTHSLFNLVQQERQACSFHARYARGGVFNMGEPGQSSFLAANPTDHYSQESDSKLNIKSR